MIKRNKQNIGKRVMTSLGPGTVKGFRGNDTSGDPYITVWVDSQKATFPFKGSNLSELEVKVMDKRVEAIRNDPKIGRNTMSIADETFTDDELVRELDEVGITAVKLAVSYARRYMGCPLCEIGTRSCPHT